MKKQLIPLFFIDILVLLQIWFFASLVIPNRYGLPSGSLALAALPALIFGNYLWINQIKNQNKR